MRKRALSANDIPKLILLIAVILGGWFRFMPAWLADFPVNDGGMFYVMIEDLQANGYILPGYTTYNALNIPFMYPPLGFYIGAVAADLFSLPTPLPIIQWAPGILSAFTVPILYLLAKEITGNKLQSAISALVFALTPHMTAWHSMGGGLTRSLGICFMMLTLVHIHRLFATNNRKDLFAAILFGSLTVLSHTEAPLYAIAIGVYIWAMKFRSTKGLINGILVAAGVLVFTAPWLALVIGRHGIAPLVSAGQTSLRDAMSVLRLINMDFFTEEPYLDLIGVTGLLGLAILAAKKELFIPGMFLVIALVNPRSTHTVGNIPLAMAAGSLIAGFLPPSLSAEDNISARHKGPINAYILVAILTPYIFGNLLYYETILAGRHVSSAERESMQWVTENTPAESAFLVVTGEVNGFCDPVSEWFPALTERQSLATLQGNEWIRGNKFGQFLGNIQSLQSCVNKGLSCILQEAKHLTPDFDYLYISLDPPTLNCDPTDASGLTRSLVLELRHSPRFEPVFMSQGAAVFRKK